jgi:hypothetical protein
VILFLAKNVRFSGAAAAKRRSAYSRFVKTVASVRVAARGAPLVLVSQSSNPPIRQAHSAGQHIAATQKLANSFLMPSEPFCGHSFV